LDFITSRGYAQKDSVPRRSQSHSKNGRRLIHAVRHYVRLFGRYGGFIAIPLALVIAIW
jgi:hypothetical protein